MSYLRYFQVGRTTLWRGAPLHVAVRLDRGLQAETLLAGGIYPSVRLELEYRDTPEEFREMIKAEGARPLSKPIPVEDEHGRGSAELSTDDVVPGALDLTFRIDATGGREALRERLYEEEGTDTLPELDEDSIEDVTLPEVVWVLERDDYGKLIDEQLDEPFHASAGLRAEEVPPLIVDLMRELLPVAALRHDFEDRLELALSKEGEQPAPPPQPHGLWPWEFVERVLPGENLFPEEPVRWVTARLLATVNELQVGGFSSPPKVEVEIDPSAPAVALRFELSLDKEVSEALARSLTDKELSDFAVIRRGAEGAQIDHTIEPGKSEVTIDLHLPTGGFPLAETGAA